MRSDPTLTAYDKPVRCAACDEVIEQQDPVYCAPDYDLAIEHLHEAEEALMQIRDIAQASLTPDGGMGVHRPKFALSPSSAKALVEIVNQGLGKAGGR